VCHVFFETLFKIIKFTTGITYIQRFLVILTNALPRVKTSARNLAEVPTAEKNGMKNKHKKKSKPRSPTMNGTFLCQASVGGERFQRLHDDTEKK
jgi:hypothetical protein